jgi:hypothetical protein
MKKLILAVLVVAASTILIVSCVKQSFNAPQNISSYDPHDSVNLTIAQLNTIILNMASNQFRTMGDSTIYGVVTADDRSNNFYKEIIIQDSTGGIAVSISAYDLFNNYPIGRKIYVKLNGLTIINYHSLPEIGFSASAAGSVSLAGIPSSLVTTYIDGANYPNIVIPDTVRMTQLFGNPNKYVNRLVAIENMEFSASSANQPYAGTVASGASGTSRTIQDCPFTASMVMYNSAYANFQPALTPNGKGVLTGIFSMYNTPQFLIRDTTDVQFTQTRTCP